MPRDFEALYRAQAQAKSAITKDETVSLPPGYLVGFDVRLRKDYTVLITAGAANVGGRLVQIKTDHQLEDKDWIAPKINSTRHYYIYLSKAGDWFVDIVAPVWNSEFLYYEQPDTNWRAVGKMFLADGQIIFAIKEVEKNEQTVTVASEGFTGKADYYCDGDNDQILINAAIKYLHAAYDGGTVNMLSGVYYVEPKTYDPSLGRYYSIQLFDYDNITISGEGPSTNIQDNNLTSNWFCFSGLSSSPANNITLNNIKITPGSGYAIYAWASNGILIHNVYIHNIQGQGIVIYGSSDSKITNCIFDGISGGGAPISAQGSNITIENNIIRDFSSSSDIIGISVEGAGSRCLIKNNIISNLDCTNAGFYAYGISANTSYVVIQNNKIEDIKNTAAPAQVGGIYLPGGGNTNSIVTSNFCYNNGSDTGIANDNRNNFHDDATDTQVYSNSWQQPVAGEPTQGELKWLPQSTATLSAYLLDQVTTTAAWSSCSVGSLVPVGTKSVLCNVGINMVASAAGNMFHYVAFSNDYSATPTYGTHHPLYGIHHYSDAGGERARNRVSMFIPVDTNRKLYYYAVDRSNATNCWIYLAVTGYTI